MLACNSESPKPLNRYQVTGEAQGTYYSVIYYHTEDLNLQTTLDSFFKAFDLSASNYNPNSIISKVNRNEEVVLDSIFINNFNLAFRVSEMSGGKFDITVRPLTELWGFGKERQQIVNPEQVDSVRVFIGYKKIKIIEGKIVKEDPRIQLDFNAIAQGYSVDEVAKLLRNRGLSTFLVDVGGEVYASKSKPDGKLWSVGVEKPVDSAAYGNAIVAFISLSEKGLATSGNYRKFYVKDGLKVVHTIDPFTGYPISQNLLSATIIAPTAAYADAIATACMVSGLDESIKLIENNSELDALLIYSDSAGNYREYISPKLRSYIEINTENQ